MEVLIGSKEQGVGDSVSEGDARSSNRGWPR